MDGFYGIGPRANVKITETLYPETPSLYWNGTLPLPKFHDLNTLVNQLRASCCQI